METESLRLRVEAIGSQVSALLNRLRDRHFQFDRPFEVFPGPSPKTMQAIRQIETAVGALPLSLKLFWERVGSIDFSGSHPDWCGCEYPDQLFVFPPSVAIAELEEFLADRVERERANYPYFVPIAPDIYHKADVSGGPPYAIAVPAEANDPPLLNTEPNVTFVEYLERSLEYGGFPGLANCSEHSWPIGDLVAHTA